MNAKTLIASTLALAVAASSGVAFAASTTPTGAAKDPAKREQRVAFMIKRLDADKDGKVSKQEMQAAMNATLSVVDSNKDGFLSKQEVEAGKDALKAYRQKVKAEPNAAPVKPARLPNGVIKHFDRIDANKDGKLSKEELDRVADRMFQRRDANKDGFITAQEFLAKKGKKQG
ncbi:EF-hand domain-containing protein [Rhizobium sp. G21]|uniref:EF-hand domain-containing protein n=1 Tax=Rhizobium sp. G21 TaxID=2758439 RepID=UPI001602B79D|nr:EF-hand domain-containing protein [Rhizobium sp. G21]MBB1249006.1 EF-hand domain-containing protein [Rhizobium sp. G21]